MVVIVTVRLLRKTCTGPVVAMGYMLQNGFQRKKEPTTILHSSLEHRFRVKVDGIKLLVASVS